MGVKICLDAGHYAKYNQSPVNKDYWESLMTWKLHILLKKYLEAYGIEVITTRADQTKDLGLLKRGQTAKGCDLFLSLHSNACDTEYVDYPVIIVPIDGSGHEIGKKLASCISSVMGTNQKGQVITRKGKYGDYYSVIYGAVSVGCTGLIIEHSFHTNLSATKWLLIDSNLDRLAKAEAEVIARHYGLIKDGETDLKENDVVKISDNATYYDGGKMPEWVKANKWIVKQVKGDRAVIDKSVDGKSSINSPVNVKYLTKVEETEEDKVLKWAKDNGIVTSETDLDKTVTFRAVITMLYRVYNGK